MFIRGTRKGLLMAAVAFALIGVASLAKAQASTATQTATITANVNSTATLTLGVNTVTFPSADPNTVSSIPANENAISITAKARTGKSGAVTLTVLSSGDLSSGTDTIPINNVTWTATGAGYVGGTLSNASAQAVGSWTGPGTHSGGLSYFLANSVFYSTGTYTTTITYTLTAP
ncbi:MAG TPA: hypothetical protein VFA07_19090 [Chthonomonadaceae bacterium]|nr:hypothetical protein [Chthonomonadaceae bacterium]